MNRLLVIVDLRSQKFPGFLMNGVSQMHDSAMSVVKPLWWLMATPFMSSRRINSFSLNCDASSGT